MTGKGLLCDGLFGDQNTFCFHLGEQRGIFSRIGISIPPANTAIVPFPRRHDVLQHRCRGQDRDNNNAFSPSAEDIARAIRVPRDDALRAPTSAILVPCKRSKLPLHHSIGGQSSNASSGFGKFLSPRHKRWHLGLFPF